jgi:hypothetical protein
LRSFQQNWSKFVKQFRHGNQGSFSDLKQNRPFGFFNRPTISKTLLGGKSLIFAITGVFYVPRNIVLAALFGAAGALTMLGGKAAATTVGITSSGALGPIDSYDWGQLGPAPLRGPQNVTSSGGLSATASSAGNSLDVLPQTGCCSGWQGNFNPGTNVLWDFGIGPDITVTFANPVMGGGAQIQPDFWGNFTARVTAFGVGGNTLGSFTENGFATSTDPTVCTFDVNAICGPNLAIFIGLSSTNSDIAKLQFDLTQASILPNDFAIGTLDVSSGQVSATPLPAALPLFAAGLGVIGFFSRRRMRRTAAQAVV